MFFKVGHGILCTASYEARKYGVRSGMPGKQGLEKVETMPIINYLSGFIAKRLCPDIIFVPLHFARYMELSKVVMSVLRRYDPTLYAAGCDEAYLK